MPRLNQVSSDLIAEGVGHIGLATFSNLFDHVSDTKLDFPTAENL
ncbi:hypothetical protein [Novipirellula maiorica]|nr:hypothetical protein [Rhodopirellula maiorica]